MQKIISYIITVAMIFTLIPTTYNAAEYDYTIKFDKTEYTPVPGEEVALKLYVTNNADGATQTELQMCQIQVKHIDGLKPTITDTNVSPLPTVGVAVTDYLTYSPVTFSNDTALYTLNYTIPEDAVVGTTYTVDFELTNTYLIITNESGKLAPSESVETISATITVTEPAPEPAKLILKNRKPYGINATTTEWAYSYYGDTTVLNDGLGGMVTGNLGRYSQVTAGQNNMFRIMENADYFADNYTVVTFNVYGNAELLFRFQSSTYQKTITSEMLKANQWNNITLIYDKNKLTYSTNGKFFINGADSGLTIGNGPDVSSGAIMQIYMQDTTAQYYIDDLAVYTSTGDPTPLITMPTVTSGTKYTVDGSVITYTEAMTVADIASTGTAVRAYASTDTAMKTALDSDTVLNPGDFVVVEAPVNPDAETSEYICRYSYYTIDGEPIVPETPTGTQIEGTDIYWYYDEATTSLIFTGKGALPDYSTLSGRPWHSYISVATKIQLGEGITIIGKNSFRGSYKLTEVVFPETTLTTIGESAFQYTNLTEFVIPDGVTTIGANAFYYKTGVSGAKQLTTITIPDSVTSIATSALSGQTAVTIKCNSGTTARTYARTNGFTYFLMDVDYEISYSKANSIATYRSFTEQSINAVAIIFNRKSGVINDIHFEAITLDGLGTPVDVTLPTDFPAETSSAHHILLWDSWTNITPLCDSFVVSY